MAANSSGCESASQTSKYVGSVATDANGVVTVTVQANSIGDATWSVCGNPVPCTNTAPLYCFQQ